MTRNLRTALACTREALLGTAMSPALDSWIKKSANRMLSLAQGITSQAAPPKKKKNREVGRKPSPGGNNCNLRPCEDLRRPWQPPISQIKAGTLKKTHQPRLYNDRAKRWRHVNFDRMNRMRKAPCVIKKNLWCFQNSCPR